ncbi:MAG: ABC transporter ATP-binding protein [Alphaproteobacteria bacterium]|nr:ABC transporter ATP-binding protein [Alphaproteobacteria bacterium]
MESILNIQDLNVHFRTTNGQIQAVRRLNLFIPKNKITGVVGESGSGKTQTFLSLFGLSQASQVSGKAEFNGVDLLSLSKSELNKIRGRDISFVFQDPMSALNPYMNVGAQILETILAHQSLSKPQAVHLAEELLLSVKMNDPRAVMKKYPHQLSGGQQQRIIVAMAIVNEPKLIIADEPTTALDVSIQAEILELIQDIHKSHSTSIVLITHDLGVVAQLCDYVTVMYAGQIVEQSITSQFFSNLKHPYSQALMASVPKFDMNQDDLFPIPGQPPVLDHEIKGCPFAPRCPHVMAVCTVKEPSMISVAPNIMAACHLYPQGAS